MDSVIIEKNLVRIIKKYGHENGAYYIGMYYGPGPFLQFGFGKYHDFLIKHDLIKGYRGMRDRNPRDGDVRDRNPRDVRDKQSKRQQSKR